MITNVHSALAKNSSNFQNRFCHQHPLNEYALICTHSTCISNPPSCFLCEDCQYQHKSLHDPNHIYLDYRKTLSMGQFLIEINKKLQIWANRLVWNWLLITRENGLKLILKRLFKFLKDFLTRVVDFDYSLDMIYNWMAKFINLSIIIFHFLFGSFGIVFSISFNFFKLPHWKSLPIVKIDVIRIM